MEVFCNQAVSQGRYSRKERGLCEYFNKFLKKDALDAIDELFWSSAFK